VALEANPLFCKQARSSFAADIARGRLHLVEKALWTDAGGSVPFHIRDDSTGWSSVFIDIAERDGLPSRRVEVQTITLGELFNEYGVPYYAKCDLEGADRIFAEQLIGVERRPEFVSVEFDTLEVPQLLRQAGYDRFQIVNQGHLRLWRPPRPPREGDFVNIVFHGKMSGLFGLELRSAYWTDYDGFAQRLELWRSLPQMNAIARYLLRRWGKATNRGWLIGRGWLDLHATTERVLRDNRVM